jgi:predicted amidohydrolase YtcJ
VPASGRVLRTPYEIFRRNHDHSSCHENLTQKTDITKLRWNVNLLGAKVYDADLLTRLKGLGCSVQMCANRWLRATDPQNAGPEFRGILEQGLHTGLFGNGTHISPLNPWLHIHYVVTGANSFGNQVNPGQHLTREEGLRLRTRQNSYLLQMEDRIGSIEPGKYADLVVLDRDYFAVPEAEIKRIRSLMTIVDGKIVHDSDPLRSA